MSRTPSEEAKLLRQHQEAGFLESADRSGLQVSWGAGHLDRGVQDAVGPGAGDFGIEISDGTNAAIRFDRPCQDEIGGEGATLESPHCTNDHCGRCHLLHLSHHLIGDVEVGIDILYIIVLFQLIHQLQELASLVTFKAHGRLGK